MAGAGAQPQRARTSTNTTRRRGSLDMSATKLPFEPHRRPGARTPAPVPASQATVPRARSLLDVFAATAVRCGGRTAIDATDAVLTLRPARRRRRGARGEADANLASVPVTGSESASRVARRSCTSRSSGCSRAAPRTSRSTSTIRRLVPRRSGSAREPPRSSSADSSSGRSRNRMEPGGRSSPTTTPG